GASPADPGEREVSAPRRAAGGDPSQRGVGPLDGRPEPVQCRGAGGAPRGGPWFADTGGPRAGAAVVVRKRRAKSEKRQVEARGCAPARSNCRWKLSEFSLFAFRFSFSVFSVALVLGAAPAPLTTPGDLEAQLAAIEERGQEVEDLTARFE